MATWTYTENAEKKNISIALRNGQLILRLGTYANLTSEELNEVLDAGAGVILKEGIVPPATPAVGGSSSSSSSTIVVGVWSPKTYYTENSLVVSPEGELLRTLRNFESGESYVF
jgi:hypothetical protein